MGEQSMREVYPPAIAAYFSDNVIRNRYRRNPNFEAFRAQFETAKRNLKKMADGGVKIVLGTDSGSADTFPGFFEHRELELMVDAGMSEVDAIKAGTAVAAEMLGLTDAGVLAVGKRADFLQLSANPLEDIVESRDIADVYTAGTEVDRTTQIQQITLETPRVTDQDRANDRRELAREVEQARIDRIPKYGKFPRGNAAPVRGLSIPTPLNSRATVKAGPPDTITVSMGGASAADMQGFYSAAFPAYGWSAQGGCFVRTNAVTKKQATACVQTSGNTATIEIRE
jgi:hypothetical protein